MHLSRRLFRELSAVTLLCVGVGALAPVSAQVKEAVKTPNRMIVTFRNQTLPSDAAQHIQQAGGKVLSSLGAVGIVVAGWLPDSA